MKQSGIVGICLWWLFAPVIWGQNDPQFSLNTQALSYYNPAAVGRNQDLSISGTYRMQWVGIKDAPATAYAAADFFFPLWGQYHGVGLYFVNDAAGLFKTNAFGAQYAFKVELWNGYLSFGINLGGVDVTFDGSKVEIPSSDYHSSSDDGIPKSEQRGMAFDMGAGIFYSNHLLFAGISGTHLLASRVGDPASGGQYTELTRGFQTLLGGNINFRKAKFVIQPSVFVKTDFTSYQLDTNLRFVFNGKFWGGVTWRLNDAVVFMAGIDIKGFRVGYAYDLSTSPLLRASGGSHEISLGYGFSPKIEKSVKNKYKSVRIL